MNLQTGPYAVHHAIDALRHHEHDRGGHSWGLAIAHNGTIHTTKGIGLLPPDPAEGLPVDAVDNADACLGHTRKATRGEITTGNAHPFDIRNRDGDVIAVMAHNGTWEDAPDDGRHSDSWVIARELEYLVNTKPDTPFDDLVRGIGEHVGETLAILHRDGRSWTFSGVREIHAGEGFVASTHPSAAEIPTGNVHSIALH